MSDTPLKLKTLLGNYPNTRALREGTLTSSKFAFDFADVKVPNRAFKRAVRELEFDVTELALVTFFQAKAYGKPLALIRCTAQGFPFGIGNPFRLNVAAMIPILTPCRVVKIVGRSDSALVRAVPECAILARSRSSRVRFTPAKP